jgi:ADP-ribose pyrophosphatase
VKNPFTVRATRQVYDNRWINVVEHDVVTPAGTPGIYGVVHFKNRAVGVVPYEDGHLWLVGQHRFPLDQYSWEIPEGGAPHDEALEEAAHRELEEETGLRAAHLEEIVRMHLSNSVSDELAVIFLARGITAGMSAPEETEELAVKRVSLDEAYRMVSAGEITDSMSVAAIFKLVLMRSEGALT